MMLNKTRPFVECDYGPRIDPLGSTEPGTLGKDNGELYLVLVGSLSDGVSVLAVPEQRAPVRARAGAQLLRVDPPSVGL